MYLIYICGGTLFKLNLGKHFKSQKTWLQWKRLNSQIKTPELVSTAGWLALHWYASWSSQFNWRVGHLSDSQSQPLLWSLGLPQTTCWHLSLRLPLAFSHGCRSQVLYLQHLCGSLLQSCLSEVTWALHYSFLAPLITSAKCLSWTLILTIFTPLTFISTSFYNLYFLAKMIL